MKHLLILSTVSLLFILLGCQKEASFSEQMEDSFYVNRKGANMPVFVRGNAHSNVFILILSGGPGNGGLKYRGHTYSDLLEEKYAMIYWDQRNQGNTHGSYSEEDVTIDQMVEDTYAVIQSIKARYGQEISLFMLGHSWGGTLGSAFMVKENYQSELKGWIEVDGAHDFPLINKALIALIDSVGMDEISKGREVETWTTMREYALAIDQENITLDEVSQLNSYAGQIEQMLPQLPEKTVSNIGGFELNFSGPNNPAAVNWNDLTFPESFYQELAQVSLTEELEKITIPTLLQWGEYDFKVPTEVGKTAYDQISSTEKEFIIYPNAGHSPMRYFPEEFVSDLTNFIETNK